MHLPNKNEFLERLEEKAYERHKRKRLEKLRGVENYENTSIKYLKIPLIGGIMYVVSRYITARNIIQSHKKEISKTLSFRKVIKNENLIKNSIGKQLEDIVNKNETKRVEVPVEYMPHFIKALALYPQLEYVQSGENEFIIRTRGDLL